MIIRTLENTGINEILDAFNESFSDYVVPFRLTEEQLEQKIAAENIKPELSAAAFVNDRLAGFILHASDTIDGKVVVYNAGTGVVPALRGQQVTAKLYNYLLPA